MIFQLVYSQNSYSQPGRSQYSFHTMETTVSLILNLKRFPNPMECAIRVDSIVGPVPYGPCITNLTLVISHSAFLEQVALPGLA